MDLKQFQTLAKQIDKAEAAREQVRAKLREASAATQTAYGQLYELTGGRPVVHGGVSVQVIKLPASDKRPNGGYTIVRRDAAAAAQRAAAKEAAAAEKAARRAERQATKPQRPKRVPFEPIVLG